MKSTIRVLLFALLAAPSVAYAVDWPAADAILRAPFGQNRSGRPAVGLEFSGEDPVRSMDAGEVLFIGTGGELATGPSSFPYTLGNWIAIDHGNNIVSTYGRLDALENHSSKTLVEKGSVLGRAGVSGWSEASGFYFSIFDRAERRWVNPAMIAPARADSKAPAIKSVQLVTKEGTAFPLSTVRSLRQGSYRIVVEATDSENKGPTDLAPQRIVCLVNGQEQGSLHLETIEARDGELSVSRAGPTPASQVYLVGGAFDLGEIRLTRGRTSIELIVRDSANNERIANYSLVVD